MGLVNKNNTLPETKDGNPTIVKPIADPDTLLDVPAAPKVEVPSKNISVNPTDVVVPPTPTGSDIVLTAGDVPPPASADPIEWSKQSWETDAEEQAKNQLLQDTATAEQGQLKSRQSIESNAVQANQEYTLLNYQQNQNIEKMGWGGGSYHDAKMQEDYIKASIQADLYGQLELQKYGYETEMAKARAAYDSNQKQLAMEYLKVEYERAYNNAQMTGVWIDPTVKDRLAAWDIANRQIEEAKANPDSDAYKKAKTIRDSILASFNVDSSLSEQGVDVLRQILEQQQLYSTNTYTMAQLEDLKVTTDNAKENADRAIEKSDQASGFYTYTNESGESVRVNIFSTDYAAINDYIKATGNKNIRFEVVGNYRTSLKAQYDAWAAAERAKDSSGSVNISPFADWLKFNEGAYKEEFNKSLAFAKATSMETFSFYDSKGDIVLFDTKNATPIKVDTNTPDQSNGGNNTSYTATVSDISSSAGYGGNFDSGNITINGQTFNEIEVLHMGGDGKKGGVGANSNFVDSLGMPKFNSFDTAATQITKIKTALTEVFGFTTEEAELFAKINPSYGNLCRRETEWENLCSTLESYLPKDAAPGTIVIRNGAYYVYAGDEGKAHWNIIPTKSANTNITSLITYLNSYSK